MFVGVRTVKDVESPSNVLTGSMLVLWDKCQLLLKEHQVSNRENVKVAID